MSRRVSARMTEVGGGQIPLIDAFADRARAYCDWSTRSKPGKGDLDVCAVLLTDLLAAACRLGWREGVPSDGDSTPIPDNVLSNAKSLPLQLYAEVFEPLVLPPEEPVVGDLSDDLIDIYRDIKEGMILYDSSSKSAAADHWRFWFHNHWGEHATSALRAIWAFLANREGRQKTVCDR